MATRKTKKRTTDACSGDSLALAVGAAAASILANIVQAKKGADLRRESEQLMNLLNQWQSAYNDLRLVTESKDRELGVAKQRAVDLERQLRVLQTRNLELEKEVADLKRRKKNGA
jgi:hypothetical protein